MRTQIWLRMILVVMLLSSCAIAQAQACYSTSISAPTPFMGNHDEIFKVSDGSLWQVKHEYQYLYEYYPTVMICPGQGKLIIKGKAINIERMSVTAPPAARSRPGIPAPGHAAVAGGVTVVAYQSGCRGYFIGDGPSGYFLLEWYGGYDPSVGDVMIGDLAGYGFKDVFYPAIGSQGRVYVDDYLLSRERVIEKYREKCS